MNAGGACVNLSTCCVDCALPVCVFVFIYCVSTGVLACLDGYMNIAIEQTEEYVNGQLKNKYGDAFLRGNNGEIHFIVTLLTFLEET